MLIEKASNFIIVLDEIKRNFEHMSCVDKRPFSLYK